MGAARRRDDRGSRTRLPVVGPHGLEERLDGGPGRLVPAPGYVVITGVDAPAARVSHDRAYARRQMAFVLVATRWEQPDQPEASSPGRGRRLYLDGRHEAPHHLQTSSAHGRAPILAAPRGFCHDVE